MPPETHFWSRFLPAFSQRHSFPLDAVGLRAALAEFARLPTSAGLRIPADDVMRSLGYACQHPEYLYQQLVISIAGPARCYGEKTPAHLIWWPWLARTMPGLKFIIVVRDPRAVVASYPFADGVRRPDAFLAARWRADQREVLTAVSGLGTRCLLLRYEDVVTAPDDARTAMATFLGLAGSARPETGTAAGLYLPWETWKDAVSGPITVGRVGAWQTVLSSREVDVTERICEREMKAFGYEMSRAGRRAKLRGIPGPHRYADILLFRARRRRQRQLPEVAREGRP